MEPASGSMSLAYWVFIKLFTEETQFLIDNDIKVQLTLIDFK